MYAVMPETDKNTNPVLASLLRSRRELAGKTQQEVADEISYLGYSAARETVATIEQGGQMTVRPELANRLIKVLPVSMVELVSAMGYEISGADVEVSLRDWGIISLFHEVGRVAPQWMDDVEEAFRIAARGAVRHSSDT